MSEANWLHELVSLGLFMKPNEKKLTPEQEKLRNEILKSVPVKPLFGNRHEWDELKDASKSAPYCIACVGDGWLSGEWDTCPDCFGTGRMLTDEQRRIYRCRAAERESRQSAKRLDAAEAEHAKNMAELAAAQEALFEAARLANNSGQTAGSQPTTESVTTK